MYKKYGKIISPMGCRAFLSLRGIERGGMKPADENDKPVFVGRFNIGAVSAASADDPAPRLEQESRQISTRCWTTIWR